MSATMLRLAATVAGIGFLAASAPGAGAAETRTSKERLSDKAADEQRVDNCRVPPERRGATPRPDCTDTTSGGRPVAVPRTAR